MSQVQDFDASINLLQTILWQYEIGEKIKALTELRQTWVNRHQQQFWSDWYRDVFNIDTANDFGLSIWGRILDVPLGVTNSEQPGKIPFGFGPFNKNFNNGNFGVVAGSTQNLSTEQKRLVIKLRYFQLTSRCTVPEINAFLVKVFGPGQAYVIDPHDMSYAVYVFSETPSSSLQFILDEFDLLPRPSTVGALWVVESSPVFGFGPFNLNFNNGSLGA